MKKVFALILALILCTSLLAGCSQNNANTQNHTNESSSSTPPTTNSSSSNGTPNPTVPIDEAIAVVAGSHNITALELNYFYVDAVSQFYSDYGSYISYFLNPQQPLGDQIYDETTGETWADYFVTIAHSNIQSTYAIYDAAMAVEFSLSESVQQSISNTMEYLELFALYYGFETADEYLEAMYGSGATLETYRDYYEKCTIAEAYYQHYSQSLEYTPEELSAYLQDQEYAFRSYSYATYYLAVNRFDSEESAKAAADSLATGTYADTDAFDQAIRELEVNQEDNNAVSTKYENVFYNNVNSLFREWFVYSDNYQEGKMAVIPYTTGEGENKTVSGYYIIRYSSSTDNDFLMKNVRHLLVKFSTNTPTADDKANALQEAENLLAQWQMGEATEESFIALVKEHSDDNKEAGGLYENIYPGQMVAEFEAWCYNPVRSYGDCEIVETQYGYHIMFFVSNSEITYRDFMASTQIRFEDMDEWYTALVESMTLEPITDEYIDKNITMA